jgi:hypothetical protein
MRTDLPGSSNSQRKNGGRRKRPIAKHADSSSSDVFRHTLKRKRAFLLRDFKWCEKASPHPYNPSEPWGMSLLRLDSKLIRASQSNTLSRRHGHDGLSV